MPEYIETSNCDNDVYDDFYNGQHEGIIEYIRKSNLENKENLIQQISYIIEYFKKKAQLHEKNSQHLSKMLDHNYAILCKLNCLSEIDSINQENNKEEYKQLKKLIENTRLTNEKNIKERDLLLDQQNNENKAFLKKVSQLNNNYDTLSSIKSQIRRDASILQFILTFLFINFMITNSVTLIKGISAICIFNILVLVFLYFDGYHVISVIPLT